MESLFNNFKNTYSMINAKEVRAIATEIEQFGKGTDHSNVEPGSPIQNNFEWVSDLLNSPAAQRLMANFETTTDCNTGEQLIVTGREAYTTIPEDTGTACCFSTAQAFGHMYTTDVYFLCLQDCFTQKQLWYLQNTMARSIDANLLNVAGTSEFARRKEVNRMLFAFLTARNIALGEKDTFGPNLKPFNGILGELKKNTTLTLAGFDLPSAIEQWSCADNFIGGNWLVLGNKMALSAFEEAINNTEDNIRLIPEMANVTYRTREFNFINIDMATATTELWFIDLNKAGLFLEETLLVPDSAIKEIEEFGNDMETGECYEMCMRYTNGGGFFTIGANAMIRMTHVPVSAACIPVMGRFVHQFNDVETLVPAPNFVTPT